MKTMSSMMSTSAFVTVPFPLSPHLPRQGIPRPANSPPSMSSTSHANSNANAKPTSQLHQSWIHTAIEQHGYVVPPHAGSFFTRRRPRPPFFEGWYLRLTLPSTSHSYAFMFSAEAGGPGTAQLLPPDDVLHICQLSPSCDRFYAEHNRLALGHWGYVSTAAGAPRPLSGPGFDAAVLQGYQLTADGSHGRFRSRRGALVQWGFDFVPTVAWGRRGSACTTATWLSRLPLFDPGYQVLMAQGVVKEGYVSVDGERKDVSGALAYCEKNWGSAFPRRWWWIQAGLFEDVPDLTVTALGSTRITLAWEEVVGIVAVHYEGKLYEFANWNCKNLCWRVSGWGRWIAWATSSNGHSVLLEATTTDGAVDVLGPSADGMVFNVRDCARGTLTMTLVGPDGNTILDKVGTEAAQVENGGETWTDEWEAEVSPMPQPIRAAVNAVDRGDETRP